MEFSFVVGRHSLTNGSEKNIAGFLSIEEAQNYADLKELDFLSNGYMYIDTSDGRYILGANPKNEMNKWYAPSDKVYVFDSSKNCVTSIEDSI